MPNTLTIIFTSAPSTEPVEFPHPNTGVYVTGTQQANGTWQAVHTGVTKGTYSGLTGRLKNYPAVSATIAASGPVLNIQQTAPAGTSASPNGANALSVTANSSINATAYRFLTASAQAGPYTVLVTQAGATYNHTGLTAGAVVWYEMQYVGGGFYDDSPASLPFSGTATATAAPTGKMLYIAVGDSITNGDHASPGYVLATLNRLGNPASVTLRLRGFSGQTYQWYQTNELANDMAFIDANLSLYDSIVVTLAFGANDLTPQYPAQDQGVAGAYSHQQAVANAYRAKGAKIKIVLGAVMNRIDSYSTPTFDTDRTKFNNLMAANYATYADGYNDPATQPTMWGSSAPGNTNYFFDQVHPNTAGAAIMAELYAAKLAPYFGLTLSPVYSPYLGSAGTASTNLAPDPNLASYAPVALVNSTYAASTLTLTKSAGVDHNFDAAAQIPLKFGVGRFHLHLPTANLATNVADPWQSAVVGFSSVLLDLTLAPSSLYQQLQYSFYFDAQKSGTIEGNQATPLAATTANWPAGVLPNLDIVHTEAVGATSAYFTYYRGDQPIRTVNTALAGPFYAYLIQSTNGGSAIKNITFSGDTLTAQAVPATQNIPASAGPVAYPAGGINAATFATDVLTGTSTTAFAAYANASTKINTLLGYVDISFPTASRAGGAFVSLFAAPLTGTGTNAYFPQLAGLYMNTDGTVNGFTGSTGGTAVAGGGQTVRIRVDSTGVNMFLGAATTPIFSYPPKASVYYLAGIPYLNGSELKTVTLAGPGLIAA